MERALGTLGPHWRLNSAWVELHTPLCGARIAAPDGAEHQITLARDRFANEEERRDEIIKQLRRRD